MYSRDEMRSKSKRPVGVTILAIGQVWIGCLNILFIPVFGLHIVWGHTVESWVASHVWFRPFATTGEVVLLTLYTGIGVGLWKLYPWARRAEIGVMGVGALTCIGVDLSMQPPALAIVGVAWYVIGFGFVIWYLMRPRVRASFSSLELNDAVSGTD
jgi:hypothetical protein